MRKLFVVVAAVALFTVSAHSQTLDAYGDSITRAGYGASTPSNGYAALIASAKGWTLSNHGVDSSQASDFGMVADHTDGQIDNVLGKTVSDTTKSVMLTGYNDMRAWGTSANGLATYADTLRAMLIWLSTRSSKIQAGQDISTWTDLTTSAYPTTLGVFTSTTSATTTAKVYGDVIYVVSIRLNSGGGTFTLTVDGTQYGGTYSCSGAQTTIGANPATYAPFVIRIPGLTETLHDVTMTVTSTSGNVYLLWMSGNRGASTINGPEVWVGNCLRMKQAYYSAGSYSAGTDAVVGTYNAKIREIVNELSGDGLNVTLADAGGAYDPNSTDLASDNFHPSDTGHAHIADAFLRAMQTSVVAGDRGGRQ